MIYCTNDRLKFTLQEENRLLMIEEGYEDAQNNKEDVEVDYGHNLVAPQPHFFSSFLFLIKLIQLIINNC